MTIDATQERHGSPEGELVCLVVREDGDITLGFEGSEWQTHGDVEAARTVLPVEDAARRLVNDLLNDR